MFDFNSPYEGSNSRFRNMMPPLLASSQTEKVIDCSVGARSSPDPVRPQVEVQNTPPLDLVEDSMKDIIQAFRHAVVPTPQPTSLDDDDELYTATPQANKARASSPRKLATQRLAIEAPGHYRSANGTSESSHRDAPNLTKTVQPAQAPGTQIGGSMQTPASRSKKVPHSITKSSRSSLAALRARTGGQNLPTSVQGDFVARSEPATKASAPSEAIGSIDAEYKAKYPTQTSATKARTQANASTSGMLRSRNNNAEQQGSASSAKPAAVYQPATSDARNSHSRSDGAYRSTSPRKRRSSSILKQNKQPKRRLDTVEQDVYDLPESPSVKETPAAKKKSRYTNRLEPRETAKPSRSSASLSNSKAKSSAAPNTQKHKPRETVGPNVRTRRMAAQSTAPQDERVRRSADRDEASVPASKKAAPAKQSSNAEGHVEETLVEFEQSEVNYDAETPEMERHEGNLDANELQRSDVDNKDTAKDARETASLVIEASQMNAIIPSDRKESSCPSPSSVHGEAIRLPATTAMDTSHSATQVPKTPTPYPSSPPVTANVKDPTPRKSTIVAFAKSGPRNQGRSSVQRPSLGGGDPNSEVLHSRSSVPAEIQGSDVTWLQAKHGKGPPSISASVTSGRFQHPIESSIVAEDVPAALTSFTSKQKGGPRPISERLRPNRPQVTDIPQPRASSPMKGDDQFVNVDDFDAAMGEAYEEPAPRVGNVKAMGLQLTASQQAMPPPPSKPTFQRKTDQAPTVAAKAVHQNDQLQPRQGVSSDARPMKRALDVETVERPSSKRSRAEAFESDISLPVEEGSLPSPNDTHVQPAIIDVALPPTDTSRKPAPVTSYGSQKVDCQGSPVPGGMIVPELSTALETYSQNVPLSPSAADTDFSRAPDPTPRVDRGSLNVTKPLISTLAEDGALSSNVKPRPAAPHEASRAVTGFASTDDNEELVGRAKALPTSNPFTKADQPWVAPSRKPSSSTFVDHLKRISAEAQEQARIDFLKDISPQYVNRSVVPPKKSSRAAKRTRSPSPSPSDSSTDSDESTSSENDLALWRNGLQPHQMNLFDEMVIVSHRLVRHLVDAETAALQIVEDYRTRGVALVEQMESNHIQQREKYVEKMTARRKKLRKQLGGYSRDLQEIRDHVPRRADNHAPNTSEEEEKLLRVMAEYC